MSNPKIELEWFCPYCGDTKGSPEGNYRGCCGESSQHWEQRPVEEDLVAPSYSLTTYDAWIAKLAAYAGRTPEQEQKLMLKYQQEGTPCQSTNTSAEPKPTEPKSTAT